MIGTLLNIKPILKGDETGHIIFLRKGAAGKKAALQTLADKYAALAFDKKALIGIAMPTPPRTRSCCSEC